MNVEQNMALLKEQVQCGGNVYTWCYDGKGQLLESNCPEENVLATAFSVFGCKDTLLRRMQNAQGPVMLASPIGLMWCAVPEREKEQIHRVWVLGPVFTTEVTLGGMERALKKCGELHVSIAWKQELMTLLDKLPVMLINLFGQYALMLQYCVSGQKLMFSDLEYVAASDLPTHDNKPEKRDRHRTWMTEQALLRMVREGDLNYQSVMDGAAYISSGVPVKTQDPLRQAKTSTIVFASLCTRAAIEGGLSPEQAYSLGDSYIQSMELASTSAEAAALNGAMYDDFVRRVHKCRVNPNVSKQIQDCCDYIELHAEDRLELAQLAARVGYTEYYLSRRFKTEMNVSLNDYIKIVKVERAKLLLATTSASVQEVAEKLNFCSRSYFGEAFRKLVGCTPVEYRAKCKKI